ncbi:MAG: amidohydrolase [Carboxylicivirga sp.]|jgi:predicted amidohydrolase YtcJ|nr:amidohydrolase [Carboxylicivirga sp.]
MKNKKQTLVLFLFALVFFIPELKAQEANAESLQNLYQKPLTPPQGITVFLAKEVVTMSPKQETATAIAVRDGIILDVGTKKELLEKFKDAGNVQIDKTFKNKVITPGLIDPHLHFWLFALVSNAEFITPADWQLPWGDVKGVTGHDNYMARLKEYEQSIEDPNELCFTWGYHKNFHGDLNKDMLDEISTTRPIIVWQRSVHEFYFNSKALEVLGYKEADWQGKGEATAMSDWAKGHVWEKGVFMVMERVFPLIGSPEQFEKGLIRTREYVHAGGITAAADPGVQLNDAMLNQMISVLEDGPMPFDYYLIPAGNSIYDMNGKDADLAVRKAKELVARNQSKHVKWVPDQIKLFTDGAIYSQLMQMKDGYLDGHHGEWIQKPEDFAKSAWAFWKNDYQLIVHQIGDLGMEVCLNTLDGMMQRYPRYDHRFRLDHFGFSEIEQLDRAAKLGVEISSNPFYVHLLGENYSEIGVGPERAEVMARGRSVLDRHIKLSFHSDAPMAPARPMFLVWSAVNRIGLSGEKVVGQQETVTIEEAFKAITIDAAHAMRKENEIGSIEIGKKANFTIFSANPLKTDPLKLKELEIWGTVYEGEAFQAKQETNGMGLLLNDSFNFSLFAEHHEGCNHDNHIDPCIINQMLQAFANMKQSQK